jgi:ribosomal protein L6P/L9E
MGSDFFPSCGGSGGGIVVEGALVEYLLLNNLLFNHHSEMKFIVAEQELEIPEGVTVDVKSRKVAVKGKLGTLTRSFKHVPIDILKEKSAKGKTDSLKFRMWLQKKKRNAVLGTIRSTIRNMITGVTVGYKFRMVLAYSHFPIVVNVIENGRVTLILFRLSKSRTSWVSR